MKKSLKLLAFTSLALFSVSLLGGTLNSTDSTFSIGSNIVYAENLDDVDGGGYDALNEVRKNRSNNNGQEPSQPKSSLNNNGGSQGLNTESLNTDDVYSPTGNIFKNFFPVNQDSLGTAAQYMSPVTYAVSILISVILIATFILIGLVTALDLLYIGIPFTRKWLAPDNVQQQQGGMGMGMSMGMGMGGGNQQQQQKRQWVSDEALGAMAEGGSTNSQGGMNGGMSSMGMGMGMGTQNMQEPSKKSIISIYLKKRIVYLVMFGVCMVLLTSSIFMDFGLNMGMLFIKLYYMLPFSG